MELRNKAVKWSNNWYAWMSPIPSTAFTQKAVFLKTESISMIKSKNTER
jgi:hypothetical protein